MNPDSKITNPEIQTSSPIKPVSITTLSTDLTNTTTTTSSVGKASTSTENSQTQRKQATTAPSSFRFPYIPYEVLVWVVFLTITALAIADRFSWNLWPRDSFKIGGLSAGKDFQSGLKEGPWTVKVYDVVARVSGRYAILALNLLLFTCMHTTQAMLAESWFSRHLIDFSNIHFVNRRIHLINGVLLALFTVVHVWTVLLPPAFSGWSLKIVPGTFAFPLSERALPGFKRLDVDNSAMSIQVDDLLRIIYMPILLFILLPLSIRWLTKRYHVGVFLHRFVSFIYFLDIIRRHSHPHAWIFNIPFAVFFLADAVVGLWLRRSIPRVVFRETISDQYAVLYFSLPSVRPELLGPNVYLRLLDHSHAERAHAFFAVQNTLGLSTDTGAEWTTALLIRIYDAPRTPCLGRRDLRSHTARVASTTALDIEVWGPFAGPLTGRLIRAREEQRPLTLIGSGSAAGYLLDAIQRQVKQPCGHMTVLYTCRDPGLFAWVFELVAQAMELRKQGKTLRVVLALTARTEEEDDVARAMADEARASLCSRAGDGLDVKNGRLIFDREIERGDRVFFQGSGRLREAVRKVCQRKKCRFAAGPGFDGEHGGRGSVAASSFFRWLRGEREV